MILPPNHAAANGGAPRGSVVELGLRRACESGLLLAYHLYAKVQQARVQRIIERDQEGVPRGQCSRVARLPYAGALARQARRANSGGYPVMLRNVAAIIPVLVLLGCASSQTVSRVQFERLKTQRQEPKVSAWYYVGSKDAYHYFHHYDLGDDQKDFRISEAELPWQDTFPVTWRRSHWRALDWGVPRL